MAYSAAAEMARALSPKAFQDVLLHAWNHLAIPSSDNSSFLVDLIYFHAQSDPLIFAIRAGLFFSFTTWFASMGTGDHSWVDRIWSIVPAIYALHFAFRDMLYWPPDAPIAIPTSPRMFLVCGLILVWAVRLTFNFYRKGGYTTAGEDYRWPYLQTIIPTGAWFVFNVVFISLYQNLLLVAITTPLYAIWRATIVEAVPLNWIDLVATLLFLAALALETTADQQQWNFYEARKRARESKSEVTGDLKRGFLSGGLFKYSRHPNFFGEQTIWWSVYLFSVAATYPLNTVWVNPTIAGAATLTLLFQGSTTFTEYLSKKKYPAYKTYQKTTSRLLPLPPGPNLDTFEKKNQ